MVEGVAIVHGGDDGSGIQHRRTQEAEALARRIAGDPTSYLAVCRIHDVPGVVDIRRRPGGIDGPPVVVTVERFPLPRVACGNRRAAG